MRECKECEFFNEYDYNDGTPICDIDGGYENCPFCDHSTVKKGINIEIDSGFMSDYIKHTIKNTVEEVVIELARNEVSSIINSKLKDAVISAVKKEVDDVISKAVREFVSGEIHIGGGWNGPYRVVTRDQYISETIEKQLSDKMSGNKFDESISRRVCDAINKYTDNIRNDVNSRIKMYFDEATRQTLTNSVVSMLMDNETYRSLSASMKSFLPE